MKVQCDIYKKKSQSWILHTCTWLPFFGFVLATGRIKKQQQNNTKLRSVLLIRHGRVFFQVFLSWYAVDFFCNVTFYLQTESPVLISSNSFTFCLLFTFCSVTNCKEDHLCVPSFNYVLIFFLLFHQDHIWIFASIIAWLIDSSTWAVYLCSYANYTTGLLAPLIKLSLTQYFLLDVLVDLLLWYKHSCWYSE